MSTYHVSLYVMAGLYLLAGINHFWHPKIYLRIMPAYIPYHKAMVVISGIAQVLLGIALLFPLLREGAAWGIIVLLIAIFPANIEQLRTKKARLGLPLWAIWLRLPLQLLLICWAWFYT